MQELIIQNVDFILQNVKNRINAANDSDLADFFGVKGGTISAWRKRNSINYELLFTKCRENGWNLDEIVFGTTNSSINVPDTQSVNQKPMENHLFESFIFKLYERNEKELKELHQEIGALKLQVEILEKKKKIDHKVPDWPPSIN